MKVKFHKTLGLALLNSLFVSASLPLARTIKAEQIVSQTSP
ncbi:MAG: hypothetical protein AB4372_03915 [Xenococcus sp. (in: cyanobacteria)]